MGFEKAKAEIAQRYPRVMTFPKASVSIKSKCNKGNMQRLTLRLENTTNSRA